MGPNGTTARWIKRTFWLSLIIGLFAALPLVQQGLNSPAQKAAYAQNSASIQGQTLAKDEISPN